MTAEVVDGVAVRREDEVALAPAGARGMVVGAGELAALSEVEFEARLDELKLAQARIHRIKRELMKEDVHFGTIPGANSPTLLKPGAELLCSIFRLRAEPIVTVVYGDDQTRPAIGVRVRALMHIGDLAGPVVGVGEGSANSWMPKYRYRSAKRACPACGTVGSIRKSKYPDRETGDVGWWCREESCKANFVSSDPAIVEQQVGTIQNRDPFGEENTLIKMARKSAFIDGTLTATSSSDLFTQDLEDFDDEGGKAKVPPAGAPPAQAPAASSSAAAPASAPAAPAKAAAPAPQRNGGGMPACARCGHNRSVIKSKHSPGWVCWSGAREPGCGYKFTKEDLGIHAAAAEERKAKSVGEDGGALPFDR